MTDNPIAGVDLEAEQVVEEEAEKPVVAKKKKIRPIFLIFGGIVVLEAIVLALVFGVVGGGDPSTTGGGEAEASEKLDELNEKTLEEIGKWKPLLIGDVSHLDPDPRDPKRLVEVTLTEMQIFFDEESWKALGKVFEANEGAQEVIRTELHREVRAFLASRGAEYLQRRGASIDQELLRYFEEKNEDAIGGLCQHIMKVGFGKVKRTNR